MVETMMEEQARGSCGKYKAEGRHCRSNVDGGSRIWRRNPFIRKRSPTATPRRTPLRMHTPWRLRASTSQQSYVYRTSVKRCHLKARSAFTLTTPEISLSTLKSAERIKSGREVCGRRANSTPRADGVVPSCNRRNYQRRCVCSSILEGG